MTNASELAPPVAAGVRAPGPRGSRLLGVLPALSTDPIGFFESAWREHGDVVRLPLGSRPLGTVGHLLVHPAAVEHVLVARQRDYELSTAYRVLRSFLGEGLLTADGGSWRQRRRLVQPAFRPARLQALAPLMVSASHERVEQLVAGTDRPVDLYGEMAALTLDVVGRVLFSTDLRPAAPVVAPALRTVQDFSLSSVYAPVPRGLRERLHRIPTPGARRFRREVGRIDAVVADLVARRVADGGDDDDLVALLRAQDEDGSPALTSQQLRDEVVTFLLAGHETTASALTWALVLLAQHPAARADLEDEIDAVLSGALPTLADLDRLPVLAATVSEALRLRPPAWMLEREVARDDVIAGFDIPEGGVVILSPWLTHRHPGFWDGPSTFRPERWMSGAAPAGTRAAYFPFGAGPRQCVGGGFALLEAKIVLATVMQRLRVDLVPGASVAPVPRITLTAGAGIPVRFTPR